MPAVVAGCVVVVVLAVTPAAVGCLGEATIQTTDQATQSND